MRIATVKITIPRDEYLHELAGVSNARLTLAHLLAPFGLENESAPCEHLLVGHAADEIAETFASTDQVDPLDVAACAYEIGYEEAGDFLEIGPSLLHSLICSMAALGPV